MIRRESRLARWQGLASLALAMLLYDRMKLVGAVTGVVFATVLAAQQGGVFLGLMRKNTMLVDNSDADVWIVPKGTRLVQGSAPIPERVIYEARTTPGVAWASPLLWVVGSARVPGKGTDGVTLIGYDIETGHGGPWNVAAGDVTALRQPNAVFMESSDRSRLGGLDVGTITEINGHRVQVVGFTSGLLPFGPGYAFADIDLARDVGGRTDRDPSFILIGAAEGQRPEELAARLQERLPAYTVYTREQFSSAVIAYFLFEGAMGVTFGTSTFFGFLVGLVIVGLTMFSAVVDNIREFGTLKAIGATNGDLARILLVQAIFYASVGSGMGLLLVSGMAHGMRSPKLALVLPWWLVASLPVIMLVICVFSSGLALLRLRNLEPAIVFRG
jgi:putative ABC transport system permease protein